MAPVAGSGVQLRGIIFRGRNGDNESQTGAQTNEVESFAEPAGLLALNYHLRFPAPHAQVLFEKHYSVELCAKNSQKATACTRPVWTENIQREQAEKLVKGMLYSLHESEKYLSDYLAGRVNAAKAYGVIAQTSSQIQGDPSVRPHGLTTRLNHCRQENRRLGHFPWSWWRAIQPRLNPRAVHATKPDLASTISARTQCTLRLLAAATRFICTSQIA